MLKRLLFIGLACLSGVANAQVQKNPWRSGIITDEFIYEKAPYPECHAATIAQTPKGLVAAWFGIKCIAYFG